MFEKEALGLAWLAETDTLRIPAVLHVQDVENDTPSFLALEFLQTDDKANDYDEELGRGLASLHRHGAPHFGLDYNNYIGTLEQDNTTRDSWAEFYWMNRLEPLVRRAHDASLLSRTDVQQFGKLEAVIDDRVGPKEPPSRLHGDLWSGNQHIGPRGLPSLIDPAVYGGHREIDLAIMRLFGGFSEQVFMHYAEAFPLEVEAQRRIPLYQLYPLLVHVNLFGGTYVDGVRTALRRML